MLRVRSFLQVLVAIALIAAGLASSAAHARSAHGHEGARMAASAAPAAAIRDAAIRLGGDHHGEAGSTDAGTAHPVCCCGSTCCAALASPAGVPVRAARAARPLRPPGERPRPDALSEALPRPPRSLA
ncbi:hypothetical protein [Methylobacterium sp. WSM2598]|uniref:hypothetical protein n=1 Tax=Methylobacterium sp. WSM2598 TaxID=398261 RepID=UPI000378F3E0|nr:hypothetical protein [Methylobacterium sp. WSM2598]